MSTRQLLYLADVTVYDPDLGAERVLRYASGRGFTTPAGDTPAHTTYEAVLDQPVEVTRSIYQPGTTQGQSKIGFGDLVLLNSDADLDALLPFAFDGRDVIVWRGFDDATSLGDFTAVFVGTMEQAEFGVDRITIKLRDNQAVLQLPLQPTTYAGSNVLPDGLEGVASDLAGKQKPLVFGRVLNIAPPCVNTARLIYQAHDGALASVDAVYDRGSALTNSGTYASESDLLNDALAPVAGTFKAYLTGGYLRLGSSPSGTVTADVTQGATSADRTAAQLYKAVLLKAGVSSGDLVSADLTTLDAKNSAMCGVYVDDATKTADILDAIANTVGAWWGASIAGQYRLVRLERPMTDATVVRAFVDNDLTLPPSRESTADPERGLPAYRVTVRYARNHTVQTTDVAGVVDDARRAVLAQEWREASVSDASVQTVHRLAVAIVRDTCFVDEADALAEATRVLALRSVQRHRFEITVPFDDETSVIDLGDIVGLSYDRYGLRVLGDDTGQRFVVIGVEPDAKAGSLRLTLWGNSFSTHNLATDAGALLVTSAGDYLVTAAY